MENNKILIIGAGWLGIPLAKFLSNKGCFVECAFRTEKTKLRIQKAKLSLFLNKDWCSFNTAILCFPPGNNKESYKKYIEDIIKKISNKTHIIFTSSTGIYPNETKLFTETTKFKVPLNKKHLLEAEQLISSLEKHTIFRLGGLIGDKRHPIKYISGKSLKNPNGSINLVHKNDVITLIYFAIKRNILGIYNVVAPNKLTRFEYYYQYAKKINVKPPIKEETVSIDRKIDISKLSKTFNNYKFKTFYI